MFLGPAHRRSFMTFTPEELIWHSEVWEKHMETEGLRDPDKSQYGWEKQAAWLGSILFLEPYFS